MKNNDKVGLLLFTDKIEKFVPPRKGRTHVLRIISEVLSFEPEGKTTGLKQALEYFNNAIKKRSIVFLLSDFIDDGFEKILRIVGRKHDLIGIVLKDEKEDKIPKLGLVKFMDAETGAERYVDTSDNKFQKWYRRVQEENRLKRQNIFIASRLDSIDITTGQNYITPLVKFFKMRERRW
jgi:uncharacterized protein (DUF58 family)